MHAFAKLLSLAAVLTVLSPLSLGVAGQQCPNGIGVRPEIRTLSPGDLKAFIDAVKLLQTPRNRGQPSEYDNFAMQHNQVRTIAHNTPQFLPWHRAYIRVFESRLQAVSGRRIMLPFWDWSFDSQAPAGSPVFQDNMFGGNGRSSDGCVINGQFRDWRPVYPSPRCLRRSFDRGASLSPFTSVEGIRSLFRYRDYNTFRTQFEFPPHGQVHNAIGSDFSSMFSPNDPLFWLHHAFVDKIWSEWQRTPGNNPNAYNGVNPNRSQASVNDQLAYTPYRVRDVLDTRNLCYVYASFGGFSGGVSRRSVTDSVPRTATSLAPDVTLQDVANASDATARPAADDQLELLQLRDPKPLSEDFIRMNNYDVAVVRQREEEARNMVKQLNAIPNYVSPAALINRPDLALNIIGKHGSLVATKGNKRLRIKVPTGAKDSTMIHNLLRKMASSLGTLQKHVVNNSRKTLADVIGATGAQSVKSIYGVRSS
ncbi:hypothetical protein THASP1DRAFT_22929 [Thamnocephalis sphaerospora]|uniref:Tyrosinase copper-binding domain-containing protein n=1 Tax=Thamnocephalis sphaerospora TaxID=78915 RepID=A0A4P9XSU6_9FUNG|nr:hypothetical protein THASP1DRAFT_22929 [Thamnocephalis sphaerospora]|eukprot:RKP09207.1 hypothetical protein THASP1DRAFT_22929 [Thamnocephalis sphaerospora]